jgi:hypothetical protein
MSVVWIAPSPPRCAALAVRTGEVAESDQQTVNAWLESLAGASTVELLRACEAAFAVLWQRTHLTLGEVTLAAVVERVLYSAKEQHPLLASIEPTTSGVRCQSLQTQVGLRHGDVVEAIRFVLTEFLTVLGNLTGQILTPALQTELLNFQTVAGRVIEDPTS